MIVSGEHVARFVSDALGFGLCPPYSAMGLERDGKIVAGVVFNQFEGANVHLTVAGNAWPKGLLQAIGEYVFDQLGCLRMTLTTECPKVAALAERLGGVTEGRMRSHFGRGRDAIIIGILAEEYRYARVRLH